MSDPMIIAGAVAFVIAAIGSMLVQVINARAAADDRREAKVMRVKLQESADKAEIKNDEIIKQGTEIITSTNGNLSKVTERMNVALEEIKGLKELVFTLSEAKRTADELAISSKRQIRVTDEPTKILEEIKVNTGDAVTVLKDLKGEL